MAAGVTTRTALQTLGDELDSTRRHLQHALKRQRALEDRVRQLEGRVAREKERAAAWKTIAERERARKRPRGRAFA